MGRGAHPLRRHCVHGRWLICHRLEIPLEAAAQAKVAATCARFKRGVCQVVSFGAKVCAAIASFELKDRKVTYSGGALAPGDAQQAALRRCKEDGRSGGRCELRAVVCADGR